MKKDLPKTHSKITGEESSSIYVCPKGKLTIVLDNEHEIVGVVGTALGHSMYVKPKIKRNER